MASNHISKLEWMLSPEVVERGKAMANRMKDDYEALIGGTDQGDPPDDDKKVK